MYCYSLPRPDTDSREGNAKCKGFSLVSAKLVLRPLCAEGAANLDSDHNQGRGVSNISSTSNLFDGRVLLRPILPIQDICRPWP